MSSLRLAKIISLAFHPIFFLLIVPFLIVYRQTANSMYALKWMLFSSGFLTFGVIFLFFLKPEQFISDLDISDRKKRPLFYAVASLFALLYFIISIIFKGILFPLSVVALGIILGIVLFEIVNFYIKASIHVGIVCAYVITVGVLYGFVPFFLIFWMIPLIGWSRIFLKKHKKKEVIAGAILGTGVTLITVIVGKLVSLHL